MSVQCKTITETLSLSSYIRGYHEYKDLWTPHLGQSLATKAETINPLDRFAVAVLLDDDVVGHLPKGRLGRYAKTISYFLQADSKNVCTVVVTGQAINLGDKKGMQVPCNLCFSGVHSFLERLRKELEMMVL